MNNSCMKKMYKSSEVCKMLGISISTLRNHTKNKLIECVVINTHRYYTPEQIEKYIESNKKR